jgi:hypothetical protein
VQRLPPQPRNPAGDDQGAGVVEKHATDVASLPLLPLLLLHLLLLYVLLLVLLVLRVLHLLLLLLLLLLHLLLLLLLLPLVCVRIDQLSPKCSPFTEGESCGTSDLSSSTCSQRPS